MPPEISNAFFSIFPLVAMGISWFSKSFLTDQCRLDSWKISYTSLLDAVVVHPYCEKECQKDKKEHCKFGESKKDEILRIIDNTSKNLSRINSLSKNIVVLASFLSVLYVIGWVISGYDKKFNELNQFFDKNYLWIFLPIGTFFLLFIYFFAYKVYRKIYVYYRCCKHYCSDIIGLVKKNQKVLANIKMENI